MQRIIDTRMGSTPHRNLRMFEELTGPGSAKNVVLITTMWDTGQSTALGKEREKRLEVEYWKVMIDRGATIQRFLNQSDSAWKIINNIVTNNEKTALTFQEERVDRNQPLKETGAGKALYPKAADDNVSQGK
jgi:hypothetical protein